MSQSFIDLMKFFLSLLYCNFASVNRLKLFKKNNYKFPYNSENCLLFNALKTIAHFMHAFLSYMSRACKASTNIVKRKVMLS